MLSYIIKSQKHKGREMAQWLSVLVAFAEDPGLIPSIHMVAHNCLTPV